MQRHTHAIQSGKVKYLGYVSEYFLLYVIDD